MTDETAEDFSAVPPILHRCAPDPLGAFEACQEVTARLEAARRADELDIDPELKARLREQLLESARRHGHVHLSEQQDRRDPGV